MFLLSALQGYSRKSEMIKFNLTSIDYLHRQTIKLRKIGIPKTY